MPGVTLLTPGEVTVARASVDLVSAEAAPAATARCSGAHCDCVDVEHRMVRAALAPYTHDTLWLLRAPCAVEAEGGARFVLAGMTVPRNARARRMPILALYVEEEWDGSVLRMRLPFPWASAMLPGRRVLLAGLTDVGALAALTPHDVELWLDTNRHEESVPHLRRDDSTTAEAAPSAPGDPPRDSGLVAHTVLVHALLGATLQKNPAHLAAARQREEQRVARIARRPQLARALRRIGVGGAAASGYASDSSAESSVGSLATSPSPSSSSSSEGGDEDEDEDEDEDSSASAFAASDDEAAAHPAKSDLDDNDGEAVEVDGDDGDDGDDDGEDDDDDDDDTDVEEADVDDAGAAIGLSDDDVVEAALGAKKRPARRRSTSRRAQPRVRARSSRRETRKARGARARAV